MNFYKLNFFSFFLFCTFLFSKNIFSLRDRENKNDENFEIRSIIEINNNFSQTFNNYKYVLIGISDELIKKYENILTEDLINSGVIKLKTKNKNEVEEGIVIMKIAASRGSGKAFRILGLEYSDFAFEDLTPIDYEKAFLYFSSGAYLGDCHSIFYLSELVFNGNGTIQNKELGEKLLKIAYKNNSEQAAKRILKLNGENLLLNQLTSDEIKKLIILKRNLSENVLKSENIHNAIEVKNEDLMSSVNMLNHHSIEKRKFAVKKLEELAQNGLGSAYYYLGLEYADSFFADDVTPRNLKKAHEYFKAGYELGAKTCAFYYADTLFYGKGCKKNKDDAKKIFISSALIGDTLSAKRVLKLVNKNEIIVGREITNEEYAKIHRIQLNEIFFKN